MVPLRTPEPTPVSSSDTFFSSSSFFKLSMWLSASLLEVFSISIRFRLSLSCSSSMSICFSLESEVSRALSSFDVSLSISNSCRFVVSARPAFSTCRFFSSSVRLSMRCERESDASFATFSCEPTSSSADKRSFVLLDSSVFSDRRVIRSSLITEVSVRFSSKDSVNMRFSFSASSSLSEVVSSTAEISSSSLSLSFRRPCSNIRELFDSSSSSSILTLASVSSSSNFRTAPISPSNFCDNLSSSAPFSATDFCICSALKSAFARTAFKSFRSEDNKSRSF
mmetsp:Transcript_42785/g.167190  ORF Transcript_42785/g.167190 Transcript_42785/m.167190 type:complete len:281 (+) Transcript_42785:526-1368(+)